MSLILNTFIIFLHSLTAFGFLYVFFLITKDWPRLVFTLTHWLAVALIFTLVYFFYLKFFQPLTAFQTMAAAMASLFVIEFVVYVFLAKGNLWFLNYFDYVISVFIAASVVYWLVYFFKINN